MTEMELVDRVFLRSDQLLWLWNAYVAVVAATLIVAVTVPMVKERRGVRNGLIGVFVFVAYANLESMRWVLKQWQVLVESHPDVIVPDPLASVMPAPHPLWVFPFHLILDLLVVLAIWRLTRKSHS